MFRRIGITLARSAFAVSDRACDGSIGHAGFRCRQRSVDGGLLFSSGSMPGVRDSHVPARGSWSRCDAMRMNQQIIPPETMLDVLRPAIMYWRAAVALAVLGAVNGVPGAEAL